MRLENKDFEVKQKWIFLIPRPQDVSRLSHEAHGYSL